MYVYTPDGIRRAPGNMFANTTPRAGEPGGEGKGKGKFRFRKGEGDGAPALAEKEALLADSLPMLDKAMVRQLMMKSESRYRKVKAFQVKLEANKDLRNFFSPAEPKKEPRAMKAMRALKAMRAARPEKDPKAKVGKAEKAPKKKKI